MKEIMQKYNIRAPRYTSYPPATEFTSEGFGRDRCRQILQESNQHSPQNISLYIHIPYCVQTCHFCGCNSFLQKSVEQSEVYVEALLKEIEFVFSHIDLNRKVTQIHWGGGTPNSLDYKLIRKVMDFLHSRIKLSENAEVAMECNPAYLWPEQVKELRSMGFNRLSLGIQDFDRKVLKAVNREPSAIPIEELVEHIRKEGFDGINFDFIYGLPLQTPDSFIQNLEKAIEMKPDRLVTFSYAHVPWIREEQNKLKTNSFPSAEDKLNMFLMGKEKLTSSAYRMIGMDHYALPDDILGKASDNGQLHRNFQGYCTRETTGQVYAFGSSAISQLEKAYLQNVKHPDSYINAINKELHAFQRGYELNEKEMFIRSAIIELMCNGVIDFRKMAEENQINAEELKQVFDFNPKNYSDLVEDGLVEADDNGLRLSDTGKLLSRVVVMRLDPNQTSGKQLFSKTI